MKKNTVILSVNNDEGNLCLDIFIRENKTFGFEEYRKDPEANEGWFKIGFFEEVTKFASEDEAFDEACETIPWLNQKESPV